jgi:molybdopterin synthase catalytic subunit/molybdopterin converting factor small subunit
VNVTVQFFSFLRDAAGGAEQSVALPEGATVNDLLAELYRQHPRLREAGATMLIAIGVEFARREDGLNDGDVVSLMPPLQGGSDGDELLLTDQPIAGQEATAGPVTGGVGGVVVFWGVVRDREDGQPIAALEYSAYRAMAEHQFRQLLDETKRRWPVQRLRVIHRLGVVPAGEASLLVRVEAGHRGEAFAAAQFIIDELKQKVPIWKRAVR